MNNISPKAFDHLKEKSREIQITLQIGKFGMTEQVIEEIIKQFKTRELIKVKFLNNFIRGKDKDEIIRQITTQTKSHLIMRRGFIITLYKPGAKKQSFVIKKEGILGTQNKVAYQRQSKKKPSLSKKSLTVSKK